MAALETSFLPVYGRTFGSDLSIFAQRTVAAIVSWNDARVTRNALTELSDRQLADIGMSRADLHAL